MKAVCHGDLEIEVRKQLQKSNGLPAYYVPYGPEFKEIEGGFTWGELDSMLQKALEQLWDD